jgi:hypothetical protein
MQTQSITMTRAEARDLYRAYKKHKHWSQPIDDEIRRAYQLLGQGRLIIKALESIAVAGLNAEGLPKLAICRADALACELRLDKNGTARMHDARVTPRNAPHTNRWSWHEVEQTKSVILFPRGTFHDVPQDIWRATALVPSVPLHLRPQRGLANYHILFEAEWTRIPPKDPFLLRRIGKADLWLVVAAWNLTEVERAALSTRITNG